MRLLISNIIAAAAIVTAAAPGRSGEPQIHTLPSLREQVRIHDAWTEERKTLIPGILRKHGVDAWLISQHEYTEDVTFWALKSAATFSARRRTTYLYLADPNYGESTAYSWIENTDAVWTELRSVLERQQPRTIAINNASDISFSSGLHVGELSDISRALGRRWSDRFVLEPMLAVELVATMVDGRLGWYRKMMETAWAIIIEGLSEKVINPGETTTEDVEWWMREKIQALNYTTWFQPSVTILNEFDFPGLAAAQRPIQHGDLLHTDFGITALGLNTDTQHIAYVMRPGDTEADIPKGFIEGLRVANRLQDIVRDNMRIGMTGNDILTAALNQAHGERIQGRIYCHPTGEFGHSAGTLIGMTNLQDGVPGVGDLPLLKNTYYSVELFASHFVSELNMTITFPLEEDVYWNEEDQRWDWVYDRQEKLHLVRTNTKGTVLINQYEI